MAFADTRVVRALALLAATLGVAAAFAGNPSATKRSAIDVDALARTVEREDDHVTALDASKRFNLFVQRCTLRKQVAISGVRLFTHVFSYDGNGRSTMDDRRRSCTRRTL